MGTQEKNVTVYCGSRAGNDPAFIEAAKLVGDGIGRAGFAMVFGGGKNGMMGASAQACIDAGGHVIGVLPTVLVEIERAHPNIQELHKVNDMHERKAMMHDLADAFIILPGGVGTLDEFFEVATWNQLEIHQKPIVIVNINGVWDSLLGLLRGLESTGFIPDSTMAWIHEVKTAADAINLVSSLLGAAATP
ncbi:MAG: TIGR00730 family Rossman fold protein [Planctomycetota bacterium]